MPADKLQQPYIMEIDILKGLCIFSVIFIHTVPRELLYDTLYPFHLWQAVPIFIILMGFNAARSADKRGKQSLSDFYNKAYFQKQFSRLIVPVLIIFVLSALLSIWFDSNPYFGFKTLLLKFPMTGKGNYYVSIVLQFIFLFPLVFMFYKKHPVAMIITCFAIDVGFQLMSNNDFMMHEQYYLYTGSILRYLSALALGIWISNNFDLLTKRNAFIVIGFVLSFLYIMLEDYTSWSLEVFPSRWRSQTALSFFYPLVLVVLTIKYYPNVLKGKIAKFVALLGKASYHIFLVQILYFGAEISFTDKWESVSAAMLFGLAVNLTVCILAGLLFYFAEKKIRKYWGERKKGRSVTPFGANPVRD